MNTTSFQPRFSRRFGRRFAPLNAPQEAQGYAEARTLVAVTDPKCGVTRQTEPGGSPAAAPQQQEDAHV